MLYRRQLEFAVGHGVSVHATIPEEGAEQATAIETSFLPEHEVKQQTPPTPADNADLAGVPLDMKDLAGMPKTDLVAGMRRMETAYTAWIDREQGKLQDPTERLSSHLSAARRTMTGCQEVCRRIHAGIDLIEQNPEAELAFRFSNQVMALQRVRSTFSRLVRKKEIVRV